MGKLSPSRREQLLDRIRGRMKEHSRTDQSEEQTSAGTPARMEKRTDQTIYEIRHGLHKHVFVIVEESPFSDGTNIFCKDCGEPVPQTDLEFYRNFLTQTLDTNEKT